jgi:hypothetical protein
MARRDLLMVIICIFESERNRSQLFIDLIHGQRLHFLQSFADVDAKLFLEMVFKNIFMLQIDVFHIDSKTFVV